MDVPGYVWLLTVIGIVGMLLFDFFFHVRKAHVADAAGGGDLVGALRRHRDRSSASASWSSAAPTMGSEYFAGYVTEKALSVDNLFVFLIIMTSFRVPREDQQKVLLFGIVFSLIARTGFIFLGAALINSLRLGVLPLRPDPAAHRRQHAQARGRGAATPPTTS